MNIETEFPPPDEARVRATAWALGQLDPQEVFAFEQEMAADPDLAVYSRDIHAFCGLVSKELPADVANYHLPGELREPLVEKLAQSAAFRPRLNSEFSKSPPVQKPLNNWISVGIAAAIAMMISVSMFGGYNKIMPGARSKRAQSIAALYESSFLPRNYQTSDSFQSLPLNSFQNVTETPLSTFSIDVDTASYSIVRSFLNEGQRPPADAVRLEELVNYFPYDETPPQDGKPFAVKVEVTVAPWDAARRVARVVLKGKEVTAAQRAAGNLVFLVDVSGSMAEPNKLPLVQQSLRLLTERLTENDRVSIVTYAGSSAVVLPSTNGQDKARILSAIDSLASGGGTNGAGGIGAAYEEAARHFIKDGVNRVILATDGDFNVGSVSHEALLALIQEKAKTGVFLSVLGYGRGNLKDDTMELLADKGNGNYAYIDSLSEARKTLVDQMSGTLVTIAKDVKIQIEFNPAVVKSYRLLGYENRLLAKEDFNDDKKDAGEIGAGHTVTALYEIIPVGSPEAATAAVVDGLKYQQVPAVTAPKPEPTPAAANGEMMNVKLRWKQPQGDVSELLEVPVKDAVTPLDQAGQETRWSIAVAGFAQLLRGEHASGKLTWERVRQLARGAKGADPFGYRGEFLQLIDKAEGLAR